MLCVFKKMPITNLQNTSAETAPAFMDIRSDAAPKQRDVPEQINTDTIFKEESGVIRISHRKLNKIQEKYKGYVSAIMKGLSEWREDVRNADERELFEKLIESFHKEFGRSYKSGELLITSIDDRKFNCYSSTIMLADVLLQLGKPVTFIRTRGHILLSGDRWALGTNEDGELVVFPKEDIGQRYSWHREGGMNTMLSATYIWCGNKLDDDGRYLEAIAYYDKVIEHDSEDADALYNKGRTLVNRGMRHAAIAAFSAAIACNPKDANAWRNKIAALRALKRRTEANECLELAVKLGVLLKE